MNIYEEALSSLVEQLKINSVDCGAEPNAPFGRGNALALAHFLDLMKKEGFKTVNLDNYVGYGDVGAGECFGILGHVDVVPVTDGWRHPPFGGVIEDGMLYGRGTLDDKGPMIAAFYAVVKLLRDGLKPTKKIRFIIGCNEEKGNWECIKRYKEAEPMPTLGFSPDGDFPVINCEKGIVYVHVQIDTPENGLSIEGGTRPNVVPDNCEITLNGVKTAYSGVSAHGSHPELGENAIIKALQGIKGKHKALDEVLAGFENYDGSGVGLNLPYSNNDGTTANLGVVKTADGKIEFIIDLRFPINYTKEQITEIVRRRFPRAAVKFSHNHDPLFVAKDDELVQSLLRAYKTVTGKDGEPITIGGGTYARAMPRGVAFGPVFPGQPLLMHQKDERIAVSDFNKLIDIYAEAIKLLCF